MAARDGDLTAASELVRVVGASADRLGLGAHELGRIYAGLAAMEVCLERNDTAAARGMVDGIRTAVERSHRVTILSDVVLQQARLARCLGDEAGAAALLAEAGSLFPNADAAVGRVLAEEAVAQALRFDPARAPALLGDLDPDRASTRVLMTRLALLERRRPRGDAAPRRAGAGDVARGPVSSAACCAHSACWHRDVDLANDVLAAALVDAQPEWLVQTIIDLGPGVHKLLGVLTRRTRPRRGYVDALLAAIDRVLAPVRATPNAGLVEPLSARELTVLRYLSSRLTYQEIAEVLYVSINTSSPTCGPCTASWPWHHVPPPSTPAVC